MLGGACIAFGITAVLYAQSHWNGIYDDAFIYLRYVRNLDGGCGMRFNCSGTPVEGFTGPLFLALLWVGSLITHRLIDLCQVLDVGFLIIAGWFAIATAAALGRQAGDTRPWLPLVAAMATGAVLALDDFVVLNTNTGLETSLVCAAISVLVFAAVTHRHRLLAWAAVAACLARPEATLFVLLLPSIPAMRRTRYLVPITFVLIAVEVARLIGFGAALPNTYYAKSGGSWWDIELGVSYVGECIRDFPASFLAPLGLLIVTRRRAIAYVLAACALWLLFLVRVDGDAFAYSRLWFPFVPALQVIAIAGLAAVGARLGRAFSFVATGVVAVTVAVRATALHSIPEQHVNERVLEWISAGMYLRTHYPRGTLVASVPVGAVGYYSSLPILDLVGLTDETIAHSGNSVPAGLMQRRWIAHERHDTSYVLQRGPGVIVTTEIREVPWTLADARAGFWTDWMLLQEIKKGTAPYRLVDKHYLLMFERTVPAP